MPNDYEQQLRRAIERAGYKVVKYEYLPLGDKSTTVGIFLPKYDIEVISTDPREAEELGPYHIWGHSICSMLGFIKKLPHIY